MENLESLLAWALSKPLNTPKSLQGPTGREFSTPMGYPATEIVATYQLPNGEWQNVPLIVPGQEDVASLFAGQVPTPAQERIALAYSQYAPTYPSLDKALSAETRRHKKLEEIEQRMFEHAQRR